MNLLLVRIYHWRSWISIRFWKTIQAGNLNIPINFAWVPSTSRQNTNSYFENGDYFEELETV